MNSIKKIILVVCLLPAFSIRAQKQPQSFTLQQAIDFGIKNHRQVLNSELDEQIAQAKRNEVRGIGLPQINSSFDVKDFLQLPTSLMPGEFFGAPAGTFIGVKFGTKFNATAGIEATQLLFDGSYLVALQGSVVYLQLSQKNIQRTKIEAALGVTKAYYSVLVTEERSKLIDANLDRIKKLKEDTKALFDNGFVEKLDLDRIEVSYNNLVVEKEKISRLLEITYALLKYQMGYDQTVSLILSDKLTEIQINPIDTETQKFDYNNRIEYSLLQTQKKGSELLMKKDQMAYLPNVVLYGSASATAQRNEFNIFETTRRWYPTAVIGARLGVPIFDGMQKHYRIQQSKLSLLKLQNDQKFLEQSIDLELNNARISLQNASATLEIQKKNITLAEDVYRVTKIKYDNGIGSNLEVMTAETSLKEAQTNYYAALYDALVSKADYDKAKGILIK